MSAMDKKYDFKVIFSVKNANPNGDPLNGNRPRQNFDGFGEVSDVCLKRKIRNRLQDLGENIFVQSADRTDDGFKSLKDRASNDEDLAKILAGKKNAGADQFATIACEKWTDVRSFGQVFAFKGSDLSVGVRGPVSIQMAESLDTITINSMQITKSVNSITGDTKGSDTMGMKHFVDFGVYVFNGSINPQLAEKTGFSTVDAEKILTALTSLFENDASAARPDGSMAVEKVYWWEHSSKLGDYSSAKVHRSVTIHKKENVQQAKSFADYVIEEESLAGLTPRIIEGR